MEIKSQAKSALVSSEPWRNTSKRRENENRQKIKAAKGMECPMERTTVWAVNYVILEKVTRFTGF